MRIVFVTDYFKKSGLGNYYRSNYIYEFTKKNTKHKVDFFILSKSNKVKHKYDLVILDLPQKNYEIAKIIEKFSNSKTKVLGLDYNFKKKIDYNIGIFLRSKNATKNYISLKYCIIKKEIFSQKFKIKNNLFFISIGSSDIQKMRKKITTLFKPYFSNIFCSSVISVNKNYANQKFFLKNMSSCSLAASNGGTTLMELLFLRKIVFVYPQNNLELKFANYLKNKGYKIFINKLDVNKKTIDRLNKLKQINRFIDQYGASRISKIILSIIN